MMRISLKRFKEMGEQLPRGYGIAYYDYLAAYGVCYPVPINIVVRIARNVWFWLQSGVVRSWEERIYSEGLRRGLERADAQYARGVDAGYQKCLNDLERYARSDPSSSR